MTTNEKRVRLEAYKAGEAGFAPETLVHIWSREHAPWGWWRHNGAGYTGRIEDAGLYSFADALRYAGHCDPSKGIEFVGPPGRTPTAGGTAAAPVLLEALVGIRAALAMLDGAIEMGRWSDAHSLVSAIDTQVGRAIARAEG